MTVKTSGLEQNGERENAKSPAELPHAKWQIYELKEVCEINPSRKEAAMLPDEMDVSFVPMASISESGKLIDPQKRKAATVKKGFTFFRNNDVIIARITPCFQNGKRWIARSLDGGFGFGSTEFHVLRANERVLPEWLFYFLGQPGFREEGIKHMTGTAGQQRVPASFLESYGIPVPPIEVQRKMVSVLERAELAMELRKKADELTKKFLVSIFMDMFGDPKNNSKNWPIIKIGDCVTYTQYGTSSKSNDQKKGYPIIGMNHISVEGDIDLSKFNYVDISREEFDKLRLQKGDVLFNRTNSPELIGKTTCWRSGIDAVAASYLVKLRMKDNCHPIFFTHLMNTTYFKKLFYSGSKKAVNQANISPTLLKTFPMYLPPIGLQKEFAVVVAEIEEIKADQRDSKDQIGNMFEMLVQRALGER